MDEAEWPPPAARVQSAIWRAEGHIERGEYAKAAHALEEVRGLGGDEELVRGLHHLAAAGWRHQQGDEAAPDASSSTPAAVSAAVRRAW